MFLLAVWSPCFHHYKISPFLSAAQALASVKTYTWRTYQGRYEGASEDFLRTSAQGGGLEEVRLPTLHSGVLKSDFWMLTVTSQAPVPPIAFLLRHFSLIVPPRVTTLFSAKREDTALILQSFQFHFHKVFMFVFNYLYGFIGFFHYGPRSVYILYISALYWESTGLWQNILGHATFTRFTTSSYCFKNFPHHFCSFGLFYYSLTCQTSAINKPFIHILCRIFVN